MYFKQKLAYMTIGCLFTLAGYFLATLGGNGYTPTNAQTQDNATQVTDEIVCRSLKIVNTAGEIVADLSSEGAVALTLRKYYKGSILTRTRLSALGITFSEGQRFDDNKGQLAEMLPGYLYIRGYDHSIKFINGSISIFNKGENEIFTNVFQAGIHNKGGGMIETRDKFGNRTGYLPR